MSCGETTRRWCTYLDGVCASVIALAGQNLTLPSRPSSLKFAVIGDNGTGDASEYDVARQMAAARRRFPFDQVLMLVNAGILVQGYGTGTWAVLAGALVGRPLGILAAVALSTGLGLHVPSQVEWRDLCVVAFIASIGFTFGLFFATAVVPVGPTLMQLKMGELLTVVGSLVAIAAAWLLGAGRFRPRRAA